jgi:hypothetical protein
LNLRALALPLLIVAALAATLGFFVTRTIAGDREERTALLSVVALPATPTPVPTPEPSPTPDTAASARRRSSGSANCPSGCECSFPPGGTVVVCQGGTSLRFP